MSGRSTCCKAGRNLIMQKQNEDMRDAWVLRAGAELWKAVRAEADHPAEDTQKALGAVRFALNCARHLRCAGEISALARLKLEEECALASDAQTAALQEWGLGRGRRWGSEWGALWGETLSEECDHPINAAALRQCR